MAARDVVIALVAAGCLFLLDLGTGGRNLMLFAAAASGLNLITGMAGQLSLGHAAIFGVGAFTAGAAATRLDLSWPSSLILVIAVSALAGLIFGAPSIRLRGQFLGLVTIAGGFVFVRVVRQSDVLGGEYGLGEIPSFARGTADLSAFILLAVSTWLLILVSRAAVGRILAAVKDDEEAAACLGIDVARWKLTAFVAGSSLAGVCGFLLAHRDGFLSASYFDLDASLMLLMVCIVGGLGRPVGAIVGTAILVAPFELWPALERMELLITAPVALAVLFLMPDGVLGAVRRRRGLSGIGPMPVPEKATDLSPRPHDAVLSAEGICKKFGGVTALDDVSLLVEPGTIHALIGPNGSGKTTFVDCITAVTPRDAGSTRLGDVDVSGIAPHQIARLGVRRTFQRVSQFPTMNLLESAAVGVSSSHASEALRAIEGSGLDIEPSMSSSALSYGQTKRLEIARAIAARPAILILDEPASGMDATEISGLARVLRDQKEQGAGVLVIDHHMDFVFEIADVITVLDEGRVIARGTPAEVRDDSAVISAYLGPS